MRCFGVSAANGDRRANRDRKDRRGQQARKDHKATQDRRARLGPQGPPVCKAHGAKPDFRDRLANRGSEAQPGQSDRLGHRARSDRPGHRDRRAMPGRLDRLALQGRPAPQDLRVSRALRDREASREPVRHRSIFLRWIMCVRRVLNRGFSFVRYHVPAAHRL